jgi:hypothetical protein
MNSDRIKKKIALFLLSVFFIGLIPASSQLFLSDQEKSPQSSNSLDFSIGYFDIENKYYCEGYVYIRANIIINTTVPTVYACVNGTNYTMEAKLNSDGIAQFTHYLCSLNIGLYQVKIYAGNQSGWIASGMNKTFTIEANPDPFMNDRSNWDSGFYFGAMSVFDYTGWMNQYKFYITYHQINCTVPTVILKINGTTYTMKYDSVSRFYKYIDFGASTSGYVNWNITLTMGTTTYTTNTYTLNLAPATGHRLQKTWSQINPSSSKVKTKLLMSFMNSINASFSEVKLQINQSNITITDNLEELYDEYEESKREEFSAEYNAQYKDCDIYIDYRFSYTYYYYYEFDAGIYNFTLWILVNGVWTAYQLGNLNQLYQNLPNSGITYQWNNAMDTSTGEYNWLLNITLTTAIPNFDVLSIMIYWKAPSFQKAINPFGSIDWVDENYMDSDFTDGKSYWGTVYSQTSTAQPLTGALGYYASIKWTNGSGYGFLDIPIQYMNYTNNPVSVCNWQQIDWLVYKYVWERTANCCCLAENYSSYKLIDIIGYGYEYGYSYIEIEEYIWVKCANTWKEYRHTTSSSYSFMYDQTGFTNKFESRYIRIYLDEDEYFDDYFWCGNLSNFISVINKQTFNLYSVSGNQLISVKQMNCVTVTSTVKFDETTKFVSYINRIITPCFSFKTGREFITAGTGTFPNMNNLVISTTTTTTTTGTTTTTTTTNLGTGSTNATNSGTSTNISSPSIAGYSIPLLIVVMLSFIVNESRKRRMK